MLAALVSALLWVAGPGADEWLDWEAPPQCPGAESVEASIAERLGRDVAAGEIEVHARIEDAAAAGYRLSLVTRTQAGEDRRELDAHDCRALADATALLVALTIDAVAVAQALDAAPSTTASPQPEPVPEPPRSIDPAPAASVPPPEIAPTPSDDTRAQRIPAAPPELTGAIAGGGIVGTLPGPSGGPELTLALLWPRLRVEVAGAWLAPRTERRDEARVRVQLGMATARACARLGTARIEAPVCGGLELGALRGDGRGAPAARTAHGLWVAPVLAAGVRGWVTPRLALLARVDIAIPVVHPRFELIGPGDPEELYRASQVSGRLWLGLEVKFSRPRDGSPGGRRRPG